MTRPAISERRRPPAKPRRRIARSRRFRKFDGGRRSSTARTCSGSSASFWTGGWPWVRRTPASTVATWRSLRSKGRALWAKCHASTESRRSIVATVRALPPAPFGTGSERREIEADAFGVGERAEVEALAGAPAQIVAPVGGVGAVGVFGRRRAGVGPGRLDQRLQLRGEGGIAQLWLGRG